jgi:hypothetical protein
MVVNAGLAARIRASRSVMITPSWVLANTVAAWRRRDSDGFAACHVIDECQQAVTIQSHWP